MDSASTNIFILLKQGVPSPFDDAYSLNLNNACSLSTQYS